MFDIFDKLNAYIKEMLISGILDSLRSLYVEINQKVGEVAVEVGKTPQVWNGDIFSMVKTLSENVVIPIAGLILTFVVCYELISMLIEKNNMHDLDSWMFFKWLFKTFVAIYLVSHTFDIVMGLFDVSQHMVSRAAGAISSATALDLSSVISAMEIKLKAMEVGPLLGLYLEIFIIKLSTSLMAIVIMVILYGRMMEIYLVTSLAPIPLATMTNREWGQIGNNYLRAVFALGVQGFFIMVCVGIYAILIRGIGVSDDIHATIFSLFGYTLLLGVSLFKTGSIAKSVLNAH